MCALAKETHRTCSTRARSRVPLHSRCREVLSPTRSRVSALADDEALLERVFVDVGVEHGMLELWRRVGLDEHPRPSFLDHEVALERLALDRVVPGLLEGGVRPGRDPQARAGPGVLRDNQIDYGANRFRREPQHLRSMAKRPESRARVLGSPLRCGCRSRVERSSKPVCRGSPRWAGSTPVPLRNVGSISTDDQLVVYCPECAERDFDV
jgi:hypothetical protein